MDRNTRKPIETLMQSELNALAAATYVNGTTVYPNQRDQYVYADLELNWTYAVAPTTSLTVDVFAIPTLDGTNYVDTPSATVSHPAVLLGTFTIQSGATAQRRFLKKVEVPLHDFKITVLNNANQALTASATAHTIKAVFYGQYL